MLTKCEYLWLKWHLYATSKIDFVMKSTINLRYSLINLTQYLYIIMALAKL